MEKKKKEQVEENESRTNIQRKTETLPLLGTGKKKHNYHKKNKMKN